MNKGFAPRAHAASTANSAHPTIEPAISPAMVATTKRVPPNVPRAQNAPPIPRLSLEYACIVTWTYSTESGNDLDTVQKFVGQGQGDVQGGQGQGDVQGVKLAYYVTWACSRAQSDTGLSGWPSRLSQLQTEGLFII